MGEKKEKKRKAPEPGTEIPYGNGTIMKVKVSNFMCHKNLEVDLGPRINFIVGENGSGKSAVLTALSVCLGMKKAAKERSDRGMKGFIREGSTQARVEVSIRNCGQDALEPELYGNVITVERVINSSGAAPFKIKNQFGKEMGSSRDALTRVTDHFNIDVDNPIVVMSQDSSRQFLHSGKDSDKYKFFVKATLLEDIQHKIAYIKDLVKQMDAQITEQEEQVPKIEADLERLEEEKDSFSAIDELRLKATEYRKRIAWAEVYHTELLLAQTEEEGNKYRDEVGPTLDRTWNEQAEATRNCQAEVDAAKEKIDAFNAATADLTDEVSAAHDKHTHLLRLLRGKETAYMTHKNEILEKTQQREVLEEQIATARQSLAQYSQGAGASKAQKAIQLATKKRDELKARLNQFNQSCQQNTNSDAEENVKNLEFQLSAEEKRLVSAEAKLRDAGAGAWDVIAKIGGRNAVPLKKLVDFVAKRANQFSQPPVGPIGQHIKLKDQYWAEAVEEGIGQSLGTWLVGNMEDRDVLNKMMRECGFQVNLPTITVANLKRTKYHMPAEKLPPKSFKTMLEVLEIESDCAFNSIVDDKMVERLVLVADQPTGVDATKVHRTIQEAFSHTKRRMNYKTGQGGQVVSNDRAFKENALPKLAADKKALIAGLKTEIVELKKKVAVLKKDLGDARGEQRRVKQQIDDSRREERDVRTELERAEEAVTDANQAADELAGDGGVDIGALQADLDPIVEEMEGPLKKTGDTLQKEIAAAKAAWTSARDEHEELQKRADEQVPLFEQLNQEHEAAIASFSTAKSNGAYFETKRNELAAAIAENDVSVAQLREAVSKSTYSAKHMCARDEAAEFLDGEGKDHSEAELKRMAEQVTKRINREEQRFGRPQERVVREWTETKTHLKRLKETLANSRGPCKKLQQGVKTRQRLLKEASVHVQKEVSHRFNTYLGKKGNAGKISVDYGKGLLVLDVKMAGSGSTVKDTRSLSGGERSYSTLALTLSLGEAIESPFRAMDEFDVFMDAVNRKVSMDNLIEFARDDLNCDKQFLFITPQDISAVCAADSDIKVQRMKAARPN